MSVEPNNSRSRAAAARLIGCWLRDGTFPDRLLEDVDRDRAFITDVVLGIARWRRRLEWLARRCADREPDAEVWPYLLVGLYQLFIMDSVVAYAAVNETVEAVKRSDARRASGFVNGILRRSDLEREALRHEVERQPLAVRESHPDGLVARWVGRYGAERAEALCQWNNRRASAVLWVNPMRATADRLRGEADRAGIRLAPHPAAPDGWVVPHGTRIAEIPGYGDGWFSVQDPSTLHAVDLLDPRPGDRVLDACAAPGGKTVLIAGRMRGEGDLVAMDRGRARLERLRENCRRLGLSRVTVREGDATRVPALRRPEGWTKILLDVPCSNTGVLQRRPDARWRFGEDSLREVTAVQRALLDAAAVVLDPGGRLVYSTCSLEPEENEAMVREWLRGQPAFQLEREARAFPPESGTDGAYAAALRKQEGAR